MARFAFQPLPAGKEPMVPKTLETAEKLVNHLQLGSRHVHEPRSGDIVQARSMASMQSTPQLKAIQNQKFVCIKRVGAAVLAQSEIPPASCKLAPMAGNDALN